MLMKIVEFDKWCNKCRFRETHETEEPCNECLTNPARESHSKPYRFWPITTEDKGGE